MARFLSNTELYEIILQKSSETKEILWVCSPRLGLGAHRVFSQEILKNTPVNIRFVFPVNDFSVKEGEVNPYEMQYLIEHFKGISIKSHENFHSNIYIFDNTALITSATLTEAAFEENIEAGVLLDGLDTEDVKRFFIERIWNTSKSIGDLKKLKLIWNIAQKATKKAKQKKVKSLTEIKDWTDAYINTWYIGVSKWLSKKSERKIKKETNLPTSLSILGDVGYQAFMHLRLGDCAYIADFSKRGKIRVSMVRITDKVKVETDEGDLHFAYETEKTYSMDREKIFELLKNANIRSKTSEIALNEEQVEKITFALCSIKRNRKRKS